MSAEAIGWVFRKVQMDDPTAKFVLVAICNYSNDSDQAWPSHATIAELTGLSKRTIQNSIKKLEDWGIIKRVRQDRANGSETSALVSIDLETSWVVKGGIASVATGVRQEIRQRVATDSTLEPTNNLLSEDTRALRKKKDEVYSEDFEALWQAYPRTKNTSKSKAWGIYRMLNSEKQAMVRAAIPIYAAAMRAENRPEDKIKHFQFWLTDRMYETASAPASAASAAPAKPFWETATRKQWVNALLAWSVNWQWLKSWGPEPDKDGCHVPQDILDRFDLKYRGHLFSPEHMAAIRERVSQSRDAESATAPPV